MRLIHVIPINDSSTHIYKEDCRCGTFIERNKGEIPLVTHKAFDGRIDMGDGIKGKEWEIRASDGDAIFGWDGTAKRWIEIFER